ncbi:MAG TPA: hypothetical protein PLJ14_07520, partial [Accumulibacter sp.]|nr:hypothetical protein [Accumulibacter sp.]
MPAAQRLPAERLYADELDHLAADDQAPKPPGWNLSMPAVRDFIAGATIKGISANFTLMTSSSHIDNA